MLHELELSTVVACAGDQWLPRIGDPTVAGWATVGAYLMCMVLGCLTFLRMQGRHERAFWALVTLAMLLLGVNKQLDLQSAVTAVGRCLSQLQGWYEGRRTVQRNFIIGILVLTGLFLSAILWLVRGYLRRNGLALTGLIFIASFVAIRAVSFHHFDALIGSRLLDIRLNVLLELSGLVLISINSIALLAGKRTRNFTC